MERRKEEKNEKLKRWERKDEEEDEKLYREKKGGGKEEKGIGEGRNEKGTLCLNYWGKKDYKNKHTNILSLFALYLCVYRSRINYVARQN